MITTGMLDACAAAWMAAAIACPPMPEYLISGAEHDALAALAWEMGAAGVDPAWVEVFLRANGLGGRDDDGNGDDGKQDDDNGRDNRDDGNGRGDGGVAGGIDPGVFGMWSAPIAWPVIAIHGAVMPDGRVLHYSYPDATPGSRARLWNPSTGTFAQVNVSTDIFCSGLSHLEDGTLYVTGGNDYACQFQGRDVTFTFDGTSQQWTPRDAMATRRWYPSNVTLGDGSVIVVSGLDQGCGLTEIMERYVPGEGIAVVPIGEELLDLYPRLHVLGDGRVAHVGPEAWARTFDFDKGWVFYGWQSQACYRYAGGSVLLPGTTDEILVFGGSCGPAVKTAERIDLSAGNPQWQPRASMHHARAHLNPVILPDGTIFAVGGGTDGLYGSPVLVPELYRPETNTWTVLPPHVYPRMYHSTAMLLPDGRVIVAGQDSGASAYFGELYSPAYLFRGARPEIVTAPTSVVHGQTFGISVHAPGGLPIATMALVRLGTTTHSVNFDQRLLRLDFAELPTVPPIGTAFAVAAPSSPNAAPPGHYMLFALDADGVPSAARIIQVRRGVVGDLNGDGTVNGADLGVLLGNWGPGATLGDLDGDGDVDGADLGLLLGAWT
ncbi:MAG TPA: DUF1929 domain-containing protein [Phycisphaerales bacterium]|nr:DUF1929 domain-containing protein [Phycisphaerales bacterium]HMP38215.1 DUF1929 domain-containing protein [Phycisphaerales bacterium]